MTYDELVVWAHDQGQEYARTHGYYTQGGMNEFLLLVGKSIHNKVLDEVIALYREKFFCKEYADTSQRFLDVLLKMKE